MFVSLLNLFSYFYRSLLLFILFFMVVFLFFLVLQTVNILVWWSVFVFMDLVFIFVCKGFSSFSSVLNYYIFQECLGFLFLIFSSSVLQCIIVMCKMGLLPFHFWLFLVVGGFKSWLLMWFLTLQKLPYMGVLMMIVFSGLFYIILFSFFFGWFQLFLVKDYKFMLVLNSAESFNWILLGYIFSFFSGFILFLYYFFLSLFLIPSFGVESKFDFDWLVVLNYVNIPLGVAFFVKFFVVSYVLSGLCFWFLLVFVFLFVNFFSLMVWLVLKSLEENFFFFLSLVLVFMLF